MLIIGITEYKLNSTLRAYSVHLFTATGAVLAMLAILEAAKADWDAMFFWLLIAFIVDGIDGPLARRFDVTDNAKRIDGVLLDMIIDYLTYVFIPAFALFQSGLLSGWTGWFTTLVITFTSSLYFADTRMKTADKSFSGFPSCWNMVVLVLFAIEPHFWTITIICVVLAITMFLPIKFIHPVRTKRWRIISFPVTILWVIFAVMATLEQFDMPGQFDYVKWGIMLTSIYMLSAGLLQMIIPESHSSRTS
jgi:phosphatidylcholine synthase